MLTVCPSHVVLFAVIPIDECSGAFTSSGLDAKRRRWRRPSRNKRTGEIAGRLSRGIQVFFARPCRRFFTPFLGAPLVSFFFPALLLFFFLPLADANQKGLRADGALQFKYRLLRPLCDDNDRHARAQKEKNKCFRLFFPRENEEGTMTNDDVVCRPLLSSPILVVTTFCASRCRSEYTCPDDSFRDARDAKRRYHRDYECTLLR